MKILSLLILSFLVFFRQEASIKHSPAIADTTSAVLKKKQAVIDQYLYHHQKDIIVLAKVTGKTQLVKVDNENWPDNTDYIYNILKDKTGHIIMIAKIPYSESGDWYIEYKNYFDENGRTFAFSKRETVFDDSVKGGVAMEELFKYFDGSFRLITEVNRLTDKDEKPIKRNKSDFDFREYKYSIYKNVNDCVAGYHVPISIK